MPLHHAIDGIKGTKSDLLHFRNISYIRINIECFMIHFIRICYFFSDVICHLASLATGNLSAAEKVALLPHRPEYYRLYRVSRKSPAPIPISTCTRHEEMNLALFANILSSILSDPGKTPDPVPEHALDVVKSEVIPYLCNRVLNFITRGKLLISQDLLSHPKEPKVARVDIW
jgi:hypothetical protein